MQWLGYLALTQVAQVWFPEWERFIFLEEFLNHSGVRTHTARRPAVGVRLVSWIVFEKRVCMYECMFVYLFIFPCPSEQTISWWKQLLYEK